MSFHHLFLSFLALIPTFLLAETHENQAQDILAYMEKDFAQFKKNLECYFTYLDVSAKKYKDNAYGRHLIENKEEIKKQMLEANQIFFDLRKKFREIGSVQYRKDDDMILNANWMEAEVTAWYIANITSTFFPAGWETLFEGSLDARR